MYDDDDNDQYADNSGDAMSTLRAAHKTQGKQFEGSIGRAGSR